MCILGQLYKTKNEQNKIKEIKQKKWARCTISSILYLLQNVC